MKKNFRNLFALSFAALATTCISTSTSLKSNGIVSGKTASNTETVDVKDANTEQIEKKEESSVNDLYNAEVSLHSCQKNCIRYKNYGFRADGEPKHDLTFDKMSDKDELEREHEGEKVWDHVDSRIISDNKPGIYVDMIAQDDFKHHKDAAGGRLIYVPFKIKIHVPASVYQNSYVTFDFSQRYDPNWKYFPYKRAYSNYIFSFGCGEDEIKNPIEERRPLSIDFSGNKHNAPEAVDIGGCTEVRNSASAKVINYSVSGGKIKGATRERDVTFYFGYLLSVTGGSSGVASEERMALNHNWTRLDNITIGDAPISLVDGSNKTIFKDVDSAIVEFNRLDKETATLQINKDVTIGQTTEITGSGKITTNGHKLTTTAPITIHPKRVNNEEVHNQNIRFENIYLDVCGGSGDKPYTVTTIEGVDATSNVVFDNCDFNNTKTNESALYVAGGNNVLINNCYFSKEGFDKPYVILAKDNNNKDGNTVTFKNTSFNEHNSNLIVDTYSDTTPKVKFAGKTVSSRYGISRKELPVKLGDSTKVAVDEKTYVYGSSDNGVTGFYDGESTIKVIRDGDKKFKINYVFAKEVLKESANKFTCTCLADDTTLAYLECNNDIIVTKNTSGKAVAQIEPLDDQTFFKETFAGEYSHATKELSLETLAPHSLYIGCGSSHTIPEKVKITLKLSTGTIELKDGDDYTYHKDIGLIDFNLSSLAGHLIVGKDA